MPLIGHLIDPKLKKEMLGYYLVQTAVAALVMFVVFLILRELRQLVIVASLGSSAFTVFAMPNELTARARNVVGGHFCCFVIGILLRSVGMSWFGLPSQPGGTLGTIVLCSVAVGLSLLVMVVFDTEHPPAVGTAIGVLVSGYSWAVAITVLGGAISLSSVKYLLRRRLKNLA